MSHWGKNDESREHFKTKADVVAYVKKSYADGAAVIQKKGDSGMLEMVVEAEEGRTAPLQDIAYARLSMAENTTASSSCTTA